MLKFIIDIFCKDTVIGLSDIEEHADKKSKPHDTEKYMRLYKNIYSPLFNCEEINEKKFKDSFTDPIDYPLLEAFQNQKALYSV